MNVPARLDNFPKISVLPHVSYVNGMMTETGPMRGLRGPMGPQGPAGSSTPEPEPDPYEYTAVSPSALSTNVEEIVL